MSGFSQFTSSGRDRRDAGRSKPGDAIRQGRVDGPDRPPPKSQIGLVFEERSGRIFGKLGVVIVAEVGVRHEGARTEFQWATNLPGLTTKPKPAATEDKAKDAVEFAVRAWLEAAGLVISGVRQIELHRIRDAR